MDNVDFGVLRLPAQVLVGPGSVRSVAGLAASVGTRVFVCTDGVMVATPEFAALRGDLERAGLTVEVYSEGVAELPLTTVDDCLERARRAAPDLVLGYGGGSSLDLAKVTALLLRHPGPLSGYYGENRVPGPVVPLIAVPTTAGTGSEVTPVAVVTDPGRELKVGVSSPYLIPTYAVCDPLLTHGCPPRVTAHSGIDAFAHAVESFTSARRGPEWGGTLGVFVGSNRLTAPLSLQAAGLIARHLPRAVRDPGDAQARESMTYGSVCAGMAFGVAGTHLAHAVQYPVGAATKTPHGLGVGLLLPYALQLCRDARLPELAALARATGAADSGDEAKDAQTMIDSVDALRDTLGIPATLADLGVERHELDRLAEQAMTVTRLVNNTPVPVDAATMRRFVEAAWSGDRMSLVAS
ncbi:iron-containing alcohol dehydrogenase [Planosporangium mesophilum]|uniref:Alcohol dehydrogenase n=1 Tax=Planosporangium mesophilum TaxID=689768 RepID=A0A8J3TDF3_9ACTN|nr:iron-containing alcohol dehydrogenase [Planosporangium mesophilum]GII24743.1 alcohol dehydrogenase [Planosporangium mesophilum]